MVRKTFARFLFLAIIVIVLYVMFFKDLSRHSAPAPQSPMGRRETTPHRENRPHGAQPGGGRFGNGGEGSGSFPGVTCASEDFANWREPVADSCAVQMRNGYPIPDPRCTPGGVNPSISIEVLRDPRWRTRTVRNCESSEARKHVAYLWYGIQKPRINSNQNQLCELDHLVPLELGGSDDLANIWPQCGPDGVSLNERYFKQKDQVERYLAERVKTGAISIDTAQRNIASDWTQYIPDAKHWCEGSGRC